MGSELLSLQSPVVACARILLGGVLGACLGHSSEGAAAMGADLSHCPDEEGVGLWEHGRVTAGPRAGIKGTQICGNSGIWGPQLRTCCPLASLFLSLLHPGHSTHSHGFLLSPWLSERWGWESQPQQLPWGEDWGRGAFSHAEGLS